MYIGVDPGGLGVATPRFWAGGRGRSQGGRERVSENTIAYFDPFCIESTLDIFIVFFIRIEKNKN